MKVTEIGFICSKADFLVKLSILSNIRVAIFKAVKAPF